MVLSSTLALAKKKKELQQSESTKAPNNPFIPNTPFKNLIPIPQAPAVNNLNPPQAQVPFSENFPTQDKATGGAKLVQGSNGTVFLDTSAPMPSRMGGLSPEQQLIENQNIRNQQVAGLTPGSINPQTLDLAAALNPNQTLNESFRQAVPNIGTNVALGAGGGAAIGAIGGGVGAIPGAVAGAGVGLGKGILTELSQQEKQGVTVQYADFTEARKSLTAIINDVNAGGDPIENTALFNFALAKIDRTEINLKSLEERDWLSKAKRRLTTIQSFNDLERQALINKMQIALQKPNPASIIQLPPTEPDTTTQ